MSTSSKEWWTGAGWLLPSASVLAPKQPLEGKETSIFSPDTLAALQAIDGHFMEGKAVNSPSGPVASGGYAQAYEVTGGSRTLYISGQIPVRRDGSIPNGFVEQARVAWSNVEAQLESAGMSLDNVVKHTTYLSDRKYSDENSEVRREFLGHRTPALTVVIADIFDDEWLLEVEAIAVA